MADVNRDGQVAVPDLLILLAACVLILANARFQTLKPFAAYLILAV